MKDHPFNVVNEINNPGAIQERSRRLKLLQRYFWSVWEKQSRQTGPTDTTFDAVNPSCLAQCCGAPAHMDVDENPVEEVRAHLSEVAKRWIEIHRSGQVEGYLDLGSFLTSLSRHTGDDLLIAPYTFDGSSAMHWNLVHECCEFLCTKMQRQTLSRIIDNIFEGIYAHAGVGVEDPLAIAEAIFGILATTKLESEFQRLESESKQQKVAA